MNDKKTPIQLIEDQVEILAADWAEDFIKRESRLWPTEKPGWVMLEAIDESDNIAKLRHLRKRIELENVFESLYADDEVAAKNVVKWGKYLKKAGEDLIRKGAERIAESK